MVVITPPSCLVLWSAVVRLGFENSSYTVVEDSTVEVCVRISTPPTLGRPVTVTIGTIPDTATGKTKYLHKNQLYNPRMTCTIS